MHLLQSRIAFARQNWDEAIAAARRARRHEPDCDDALVIMAECYKRRGDRRRAVILWERFAGRHPDDGGALLALVDLHARSGAGERSSEIAAGLVARTSAAELRKLLHRPEVRGIRLHLPAAKDMAAIVSAQARMAVKNERWGRAAGRRLEP
jgi:hypothetical protein